MHNAQAQNKQSNYLHISSLHREQFSKIVTGLSQYLEPSDSPTLHIRNSEYNQISKLYNFVLIFSIKLFVCGFSNKQAFLICAIENLQL